MYDVLQTDGDPWQEDEIINQLKALKTQRKPPKTSKAAKASKAALPSAAAIVKRAVTPTLKMLPRDIFANVFAELRTPTETITAPLCNRTEGPYRSVADYLYTHMHLLRTDFFAYLQHGILQLRNSQLVPLAPDDDPGNANTVFWRFNDKHIEFEVTKGTHKRHIVRLSPDEVRLVKRVEECKKRGGKEENYVPFMIGSLLLFTTSVQLENLVLATVMQLDIEKKLVS